ncbi:MAG: hypothetical protein WCJ03_00890 [Bacteroidales bacterium]
MKKSLLFFAILLLSNMAFAQSSVPEKPDADNKFVLAGNAQILYSSSKDAKGFGDLGFKPIFLVSLSDQLFFEGEMEFGTSETGVETVLEYANMCYLLNDYVTLHAGRFLPKFGAYRGRFGEAFLNHFASDAVGFGDGGIGAMNEMGVGAQGGFNIGATKLNYDFYLSNGTQFNSTGENIGNMEYEAYVPNNKKQAIGGRVGILPLSNSSLEIGYSFQQKSKTTADADIPNAKVFMQAVDVNYIQPVSELSSTIRLQGEYKTQDISDAGTTLLVANDPTSAVSLDTKKSAYYVSATIRPSLVQNKILRNIDFALRFSGYNLPSGVMWDGTANNAVAMESVKLRQTEYSVNYWLKYNTVVKFTYVTRNASDYNPTFMCQFVMGF